MKYSVAIIIISFILICAGCKTSEYKSAQTLDDFTQSADSSINNPSENKTDKSNVNQTRTLTYEIEESLKSQIDELLDEYFGNDEGIMIAAEQKLLGFGTAIIPYMREKITEENQLLVLNLINKLNKQISENNNANNIEQPMQTSNNESSSTSVKQDILKMINVEINEKDIDKQSIAKFFVSKLKLVEKAFNSGNYLEAKRIAESLLVIFPEQQEFRSYLQNRINQCNDIIQSNTLLASRVAADEEVYEYGDKINFRISMQNVTGRVLKIVFSHDVAKARATYERFYSPCTIYFKLTQWTDIRSRFSAEDVFKIQLEGEVVLMPGEIWYHVWEYNTAKLAEVNAIGDIEVRAEIRPLEVIVDDEPASIRMFRARASSVKVLPKGFKTLKNDDSAIESLKQAINENKPMRLMAAATALSQQSEINWQATEILLETLKVAREQMRTTIFEALAIVTGYQLGYDERHWRIWFEANKNN